MKIAFKLITFLFAIICIFLCSCGKKNESLAFDTSTGGAALTHSEHKRILIICSRQISHRSTFDAISLCIKNLKKYYPYANFDILELNALALPDDSYKTKFDPYKKYLKEGYYQMVIPIFDKATELLAENTEFLPQNLMVVAFSDLPSMVKLRQHHKNSTGFYEYINIAPTLDFALKIFPKAKHITIIHDNYPSGHSPKDSFDMSQTSYNSIPIKYISDAHYSTGQMIDEASKIEFGDILIFCPWRNLARDGYSSLEYIGDLLASRVKAPIFVITSALIDRCALGGVVNFGSQNGISMAELARQAFINGNAADIPFGYIESLPVFDENIAKKFSIDVPHMPNMRIINHKPSIIEAHIGFVASSIFVIFALVATIVILLRKRILEKRINAVYESLPLYFAICDSKGKFYDFHSPNKYEQKINSVYELDPFIKDLFFDEIGDLSRKNCTTLNRQFKSPKSGFYYNAIIKRAPYEFGDDRFIIMCFDITEQALIKEKIENLLENEKILRTAIQQVAENRPIAEVAGWILENSTEMLEPDILSIYELNSDNSEAKAIVDISNNSESSLFAGGVSKDSELLKSLQDGNMVLYSSNAAINPEIAPLMKSRMDREGIDTAAMLGVVNAGKLKHIVFLAYTSAQKKLTQKKLNYLKNITKILQIAVGRWDFYEKLQVSQTQKKLIFDHMRSPVLLFGTAGKLLYVNNAAAALVGKNSSEITDCKIFSKFCQKELMSTNCTVARVIRTRQTVSKAVTDGKHKYRLTASPIIDDNGKLVNVLESAIDVTEIEEKSTELASALVREQRANASLAKAVQQAEDANRAKSYFLATMSHELRTPLNSIIGYSELNQDTSLSNSERMENARNINFSANALLALINDILDLSKIESDKIEIIKKPCDIRSFLDDLVKMFILPASKKIQN